MNKGLISNAMALFTSSDPLLLTAGLSPKCNTMARIPSSDPSLFIGSNLPAVERDPDLSLPSVPRRLEQPGPALGHVEERADVHRGVGPGGGEEKGAGSTWKHFQADRQETRSHRWKFCNQDDVRAKVRISLQTYVRSLIAKRSPRRRARYEQGMH